MATSLTSARVGVGEVIIDSSICVATTTGLPNWRAHGDDPVLQRRHLLGRKLDAKVAARDHHRVGERDDVVEPVDRRRLLDLGEQRRALADQRARFGDVLGPLHERQRDPVGPLLEREGEVGAVLVGQRRDRHHHVGHVDALVVATPRRRPGLR